MPPGCRVPQRIEPSRRGELVPSDSAALCLCGGGGRGGGTKKAQRRQLYYFTPKIVDSQCVFFFFPSLAPPFQFSPLATRSAVTAPPESLRNDSTLPPPRLVSGDQPRRLSPLWSRRRGVGVGGGGGAELNRFFLNLGTGEQRRKFSWREGSSAGAQR